LFHKGAYLLVAAVFFLFASVCLFSQTQTTGRIAGALHDVQRAAIAGAQIVLRNPATSARYSVGTDGTGSYSVPFLPPGSYDLSVSAHGFAAAEFRSVWIGLSETTTLNAVLLRGFPPEAGFPRFYASDLT